MHGYIRGLPGMPHGKSTTGSTPVLMQSNTYESMEAPFQGFEGSKITKGIAKGGLPAC